MLEAEVSAEGGSTAISGYFGTTTVVYKFRAVAQHSEHIVAVRTLYGGSYNLFLKYLSAGFGMRQHSI